MNANETMSTAPFMLLAEFIENGRVMREWLNLETGRRFTTGGN